jgi:type II secretory pathway component PulF
MSGKKGFCPGWPWWIQAGQRLEMGLDIRQVMRPSDDIRQKRVRRGLDFVQQGISSGESVVQSMRLAGIMLDGSAWSLLEVGEYTGKLGEAMRKVGDSIRMSEQTGRELRGQLMYPLFVCVVGFLVMVLILVWVIPQMRELGRSMGLEGQLPWLTEHIGHLYGAITLVLAGIVLLSALAGIPWRWCARRYERCGIVREWLIRQVPLLWEIFRSRRESATHQRIATLLQGGITLPRSLQLLGDMTEDQWEKRQYQEFRKRLLMGTGFEESIKQFSFIRKENVTLLIAGQESGRLEVYMHQLAGELEDQVKWKLKQLVRFVEPAMLLGLSGAIGGLVLAYLLPMVRMFEQLSM